MDFFALIFVPDSIDKRKRRKPRRNHHLQIKYKQNKNSIRQRHLATKASIRECCAECWIFDPKGANSLEVFYYFSRVTDKYNIWRYKKCIRLVVIWKLNIRLGGHQFQRLRNPGVKTALQTSLSNLRGRYLNCFIRIVFL